MHKGEKHATCWQKFAVAVTAAAVPLLGVALFSSNAGGAVTKAPGPASNYQFSVEPYAAPGTQQRSSFTYELQPGHSILDQVAILNSSSNPESFIVYPEDATNIKGTGGFGFQEQNKIHNTTVGKWLTIGETQITIPAGEEVVDTFQLSIPANAPPGDHVGAIVVQQLHSQPQLPSKQGVNLVLRFAVPMYVRVVGPIRPGMTIESLKVFHQSPLFPYLSGGAKTAVRFTLVNTGNIILIPKTATVSITALVGGTIHSYTVHRGTGAQSKKNPLPAQILPGGQLILTELWSGIPPFDPLTAHVTVSANTPTTSVLTVAASSTTFWYFPWLLVVIVVALIVGLIVWRRRRRRQREPSPGAPGTSPDNTGAAPDSGLAGPTEVPVEEVGV